jgi:DNA-binding HxlR family transcriptional regulator
MLEEEGIVAREQVSSLPPHVIYRLTEMGAHLSGVIRELTNWSRTWLCVRPDDGFARYSVAHRN